MNIVKNYYELCKPNVVLMMLLCALVGIVLASETLLPFMEIIIPLTGIALCSGSAAAINQIIDREADAEMDRTDKRPIPQGEVSVINASIFALGLRNPQGLFFAKNKGLIFGTDHGPKGMHNFSRTHKCSPLCKMLFKRWVRRVGADERKSPLDGLEEPRVSNLKI